MNTTSQKTFEERLTALEAIFLNQKEILTFKEACVYTGISSSTLYKMTAAKKIPHYKTTALYYSWIRQHRVNAVA